MFCNWTQTESLGPCQEMLGPVGRESSAGLGTSRLGAVELPTPTQLIDRWRSAPPKFSYP